MRAAGAHEAVPRGHVLGAELAEHAPALVELARVEGVGVVVVDRLDVVVPPLGEDDAAILQQGEERVAGGHAVVGVLPAAPRAPQEAPVVDDALVVRVHVPPEPVEARELAVARVLLGDVLAPIVALHAGADLRVERGADVQRQVHWVVRHAVGLVGRHRDDDALLAHFPLPMALKVRKKMRRSSARLAWRT